MNEHFLYGLLISSNYYCEVDAKPISYFTNTFLLLICSSFVVVNATFTSPCMYKFVLDVFASCAGLAT